MSEPSETIDALGLLCPLPVLRLRKRLLALGPGAVVAIVTDDPVAVIDIPHFCAEHGHHLMENGPRDGGHRFVVRAG